MTDINQASELYELCKEVYERTGWLKYNKDFDADFYYATNDLEFKNENYEVISREHYHFPQGFIAQDFIPLYTSDYLLEKLPPTVKNSFDGDDDYLILYKKSKRWYADYMGQFKRQESDTPLKALLKLTIRLHEDGLL